MGIPWCPLAETVCPQCRGPRFDPWLGNKIPHAPAKTPCSQISKYSKKKKKMGGPFSVLRVETNSPIYEKCVLHFMLFYLVIACSNCMFCFWHNRLKVIENELMQASTKKFCLEKFYKEPSVSSIQMVDCCKRLLEQSLPYLQGMHLCISHFYSVMQDGDLCIPWNWKNGEAIK